MILGTVFVLGGAVFWKFIENGNNSRLPNALEAFELHARPQSERYLFDYAGVLRHYEESAHRYLRRIASRCHLEALVVTVPTLPASHSIETLAADIVNGWRIGADYDGRGLLLLLIDGTKQVKLEVNYELEDVFTDAFSGYVEEAVALDPANGYAYALMARDYVLIYRKASGLAKERYRKKALAMKQKAASVPAPDTQRLHWLRKWMQRRMG
jgi:hypothetical protein